MLPITQRFDNDDHYDGGNTHQFIIIHDTGNPTDSDEGNAAYFCTRSVGASAHFFVDNNSITQIVREGDCSWHCGDGRGKYGITNINSLGVEMCRVNNKVTAATQANTIELVKHLMAKYGIPASKVLRHYDASRKLCPSSLSANNWAAWWAFKEKLVMAAPVVAELYRVRKSWTDMLSQIGAYSVFETAKAMADKNPGYYVFDSKGNAVHPTSAPAPAFYGSPETQDLQKKLNRLWFAGENGQALVENGCKDANTIYAIRKFQAVCGLTVDGSAGINTWTAINKILSKPVCGMKFTERTATRYIQWRFDLKVDGVFWTTTATRVKSYQAERHLTPVDGVVGGGTWKELIG
jgi:hypothetical protein